MDNVTVDWSGGAGIRADAIAAEDARAHVFIQEAKEDLRQRVRPRQVKAKKANRRLVWRVNKWGALKLREMSPVGPKPTQNLYGNFCGDWWEPYTPQPLGPMRMRNCSWVEAIRAQRTGNEQRNDIPRRVWRAYF